MSADGTQFSAFELVPRPRAVHWFARIVLLLFLLLPIAMVTVPWTQNVPGKGRVTALDPIDRVQILPVPVTGRLVRLEVREGSRVEQGQVLAELADQDPQYALRLEQQFEYATDKVEAARDQVEFYELQLGFLEESRAQALASARFDLEGAIEKVRAEEQALEAEEAIYEQKFADRERKWALFQQGVRSELDYQKAEADARSAKAKVEAAKAKVELARNEEKAKMAVIGKVGSDLSAKLESTKSAREEARGKLSLAQKELTDSITKLERQKTQVVTAPRAGTVLRVHAANSADLLQRGDPLIELIPDTDELAVELWVSGLNAPLIEPGRKVRLQFEGWPAVQFSGWPSVAVGTFGGEVAVVDAHAMSDGRLRVLVVPDPDDAPWPDAPYLRQGGRASGWLLLNEVSLGYEIWRQLNAFPPSIRDAPPETGMPKGGKASKDKGGADEKS